MMGGEVTEGVGNSSVAKEINDGHSIEGKLIVEINSKENNCG